MQISTCIYRAKRGWKSQFRSRAISNRKMVESSTMPLYKAFEEFDLILIASVVITNKKNQHVKSCARHEQSVFCYEKNNSYIITSHRHCKGQCPVFPSLQFYPKYQPRNGFVHVSRSIGDGSKRSPRTGTGPDKCAIYANDANDAGKDK